MKHLKRFFLVAPYQQEMQKANDHTLFLLSELQRASKESDKILVQLKLYIVHSWQTMPLGYKIYSISYRSFTDYATHTHTHYPHPLDFQL